MPIDKIIPSVLNKSDDERLIKKNEMTDALNITVSTSGDGSGFVVKNAKGTTAVLASDSGLNAANNYRVLGSCVDEEDQMVYFAVYESERDEHGIYRVNMGLSTPTYEAVFVSPYLFDSEPDHVDMDVLRADVNQEGTIVPILYMTDGVNNPKKINVNRAMDASDAGGYATEEDIREFLSAAKTRPIVQLNINTGTDINFDGNFIYGNNYSFCIQWVYKDGEHSAFSNISEVCLAQPIVGLKDDGVKRVAGNKYFFEVPVGTQEVVDVNVAFRNNQTGVYYMAERIVKGSDIQRDVRTIWDDSEGIFSFYGDADYEVIPPIEANKPYDNVPFVAKSQTIADGRLFYANYQEGRETPDIKADLSVTYDGIYSDNDMVPTFSGGSAGGSGLITRDTIEIDFSNLKDTIADGDGMYIDFVADYETMFVQDDSGTYILDIFTNPVSSARWECGQGFPYILYFDDFSFRLRYSYSHVGSSTTRALFLNDLATALSSHEMDVEYYNQENPGHTWEYAGAGSGSDINASVVSATITLGFTASVTNDVLSIFPRVKAISDWDVNVASAGTYSAGPDSIAGKSAYTGDYGSAVPSVNDVDTTPIMREMWKYKTFKSGANHKIGMVFYDKEGRNSFVRELGSVYVPTQGERDQGQRGVAKISVTFPQVNGANQSLPDWVEKFQFVHGGSNIDRFKQYSVSGGFANYWRESDWADQSETEDVSDNIYLSLKGWQGSQQSYTGTKGAQHGYNFKEGDILRVVSYDKVDDGDEVRVYPEKLEFKVVDIKRLRKDEQGAGIDAYRAEIEEMAAEYERKYGATGMAIDDSIRSLVNSITGKKGDEEDYIRELVEQEEEEKERYKKIPLSERNDIFPGDMATAKGQFLVLEHNGVEGWGPDDLIHTEISGGTTVDSSGEGHSGLSADRHYHVIKNWMRNVIVEIYTPKKTLQPTVYKDFSEVKTKGVTSGFNSDGTISSSTDFSIREGDTWFKKTPINLMTKNNTGGYSDQYFNWWKLKDFYYKDMWIESRHGSHFFPCDAKRFGKPHTINKYAATNNRSYSLTYSDKYNSDSPVLTLSKFNLSRANYMDLPSDNSQIDRIFSSEGYLNVVQGSRVSKIPIGKTPIKLANNTDILTATETILGTPTYYAGKYGTRGLSEAALMHNGVLFFIDYVSRKVIQVDSSGMTEISSLGMDSFFQEKLAEWSRLTTKTDLILGYDPDYDELIVFAQYDSSQSFDGFCVAFNTKLKRWTSRYDFADTRDAQPTRFEKIGNKLISCAWSEAPEAHPTEDTLFHIHQDSANRAEFYGDQKTSKIDVVSNANPSMVKVFESVSYEGDTDGFTAVINTSDQNSQISSWEERERGYYSVMPRDLSSNSTSHKIPIGKALASLTPGSGAITFSNKLSRIGIPYGAKLYNETKGAVITDDGTTSGTEVTVTAVNGKELSFTPNLAAANVVDSNDVITVLLSQSEYGDAIRDYFCKVQLTHPNTNGDEWELFSINTHYDRSRLGSENG